MAARQSSSPKPKCGRAVSFSAAALGLEGLEVDERMTVVSECSCVAPAPAEVERLTPQTPLTSALQREASRKRSMNPAEAVADDDEETPTGIRAMLSPFRIPSVIDRMLHGKAGRFSHSPQRTGIDAFVIHPRNRLKMIFDTVVQAIALYSVVMLPLKFAFGTKPSTRTLASGALAPTFRLVHARQPAVPSITLSRDAP
jgi:hypothetical protein